MQIRISGHQAIRVWVLMKLIPVDQVCPLWIPHNIVDNFEHCIFITLILSQDMIVGLLLKYDIRFFENCIEVPAKELHRFSLVGVV